MATLYHLSLCPFSRFVRLVMHEKKRDFDLISEPTWKRREDYLELNPLGEVPTLVTDDGLVHTDALAIVLWLEKTYPDPGVYPPEHSIEIMRLVHMLSTTFERQVGRKIVFEKVYKRLFYATSPDMTRVRQGLQNLDILLEYFCWLLSKRHWLACHERTLADLCLGAHLSCLDYLGHVPWHEFPELQEWYGRLKSHPCFRPLLADRVPGLMPSPHYRLLDF